MNKVIKLLFCVALVGLTACSSTKETKNIPAALVEFKSMMSIRQNWSVNVGNSGDYVFSPVAVAGNVYGASANGNLIKINVNNGREIWQIKVGSQLTAGVGADANAVVVVGEKGMLYCYDVDGKLLWKTQVSSEVLSTPVVGGGLIIVRSIDNHIAAYDVTSGKRRWLVERTLPSLFLRSAIGMVIADNSVFVGLPGGKLISLTLNSGSVRWEASVGEPKGATELERVADVSGVPVVIGSDVCASAYQGKVSCFDIKTGVMRWGKTLSTDRGLSVDERFVFALDDKGSVNGFGKTSGISVWKNDKLAYRSLSSPVSFGQAVAVADYVGYIHFLSREDGGFLARVSTDGSPVLGSPIVVGANVIFQTKAGNLIAFGIN